MNTQVRFRAFLSLSTLLLMVFPLAVFASEPVGHMTANAAGISWQIGGDNQSVTLTISGPNDFAYTHEFVSAHSISLRAREIGNNLPDGSYVYELRVTPRMSPGLQMQLAAAHAANDNSEIARLRASAGLNEGPVQSGAFAILNGSFVSSDNTEPGAPNKSASVSASRTDGGSTSDGGSVTTQVHKAPVRSLDVVTADDAIIQGSACIGLDCVVNESFGFDTVRLKENNTRIKFDDTSTSTGFPNVDWQLTANDSASGGANKFSIEDITNSKVPFTITATAPTNSIFVASTGKVGFGTATPGLNLHISATDTPAIRQEQTSGGGFTAQTWDIGANEANWFVRDVTGGSRLPLRIRPGAPTSSVDISASGNVGIGSASPLARLYVSDTTQNASRITLAGQEYFAASNTSSDGLAMLLGVNRTGNRQLWLADTAGLAQNGTNRVLQFSPNSGQISAISTDASPKDLTLQLGGGNLGIGVVPSFPIHHSSGAFLSAGGAWTNASSREYKTGIQDLGCDEAMDAFHALNPVTFAYKTDPAEHHVGFIAEDVPSLVATQNRKGLSPMDIVAVLTKVVQEQESTIQQLSKRIDQLEKHN
jgi:hypothetical protein